MGMQQQLQQAPVAGIQSASIHPVQGERFIHQLAIDAAFAVAHTGHITHPAQQSIGDARGAPATQGDLRAGIDTEIECKQAGGPFHDRPQILQSVELQSLDQSETVAQR